MGSYIAWINLAVLALFLLFSIFAPFLTPYQPNEQSLMKRLQPPGTSGHILGTDELGRDIYTRLVYGSRTSISVGILAALLSGGIGIILGLLSGYFPKADAVIMRIADIQLAFPSILLALAIVAVLGGGFFKLILVLGITAWVSYARVIRSEVLSIKTSDYILAAQTVGVGEARIMAKHIFPNILARAVTVSTFQVATAIISESSLSFLGLGIPPTIPTWGNMLYAGQLYMSNAWWISLFPGICIMLVVLSINILGDVLRDSLAPKSR